jgi:hypothetical protein
MPDVCGTFTAVQSPTVCGPWSVAAAIAADGRPVRLSCLALPDGAPESGIAGAITAFQRIVEAAAGGETPATVLGVVGGGVQDGVFWLAEEMPTCQSLLEAVLLSGPMAVERVNPFLYGLAAALEPLHAAGLYHGWVSPLNVFPEASAVRLGGWVWPSVMAKLAEAGGLPEWPDAAYAAPETRLGTAPNARSEVYSSAALVSYAATGSPLGDAASLAALPPALGRAVYAGLSADPAARYKGVKEMVVDVTVEQAIAMTDEAETNAVPIGGEVPDWARDLLAETIARRESGIPLVDVAPAEAAPAPPARAVAETATPAVVAETTVHVEPATAPIQSDAPPLSGAPVFEWNVGEQKSRAWMPLVVSVLSVIFVLLGVAITIVRHR